MQPFPSINQACTRCGHCQSACICHSNFPYYGHQSSGNFQSNEYDNRLVLCNSSLQTREEIHTQHPPSCNYNPVAQAADTISSQYYDASFVHLPGIFGHSQEHEVAHAVEPVRLHYTSNAYQYQLDPHWGSTYTLPPHNQEASLNYDSLIQMYDRHTPQSEERSDSHWHSPRIREPNNTQSPQSGFPSEIPLTPLRLSSRYPSRRIYICPDCGGRLKSKQGLTDHIEAIHRKNKRYNCAGCGHRFLWKQSRDRHQKSRCPAIKAHLEA